MSRSDFWIYLRYGSVCAYEWVRTCMCASVHSFKKTETGKHTHHHLQFRFCQFFYSLFSTRTHSPSLALCLLWIYLLSWSTHWKIGPNRWRGQSRKILMNTNESFFSRLPPSLSQPPPPLLLLPLIRLFSWSIEKLSNVIRLTQSNEKNKMKHYARAGEREPNNEIHLPNEI